MAVGVGATTAATEYLAIQTLVHVASGHVAPPPTFKATVMAGVGGAFGGGLGHVGGRLLGKLFTKADEAIASKAAKQLDEVIDGLDNLPGWGSASKLADNLSFRNWQSASIEKAIARHVGENYTTWVTKTGKRIYENPATGRQIVHDLEGGFFRIFQPKTIGSQKGTYLNMLGKELQPARFMKNGQVGTPLLRDVNKSLWQQESHFFIKELLN